MICQVLDFFRKDGEYYWNTLCSTSSLTLDFCLLFWFLFSIPILEVQDLSCTMSFSFLCLCNLLFSLLSFPSPICWICGYIYWHPKVLWSPNTLTSLWGIKYNHSGLWFGNVCFCWPQVMWKHGLWAKVNSPRILVPFPCNLLWLPCGFILIMLGPILVKILPSAS